MLGARPPSPWYLRATSSRTPPDLFARDKGPLATLTFGVRDFAPTLTGSSFIAEATARGRLVGIRVALAPVMGGGLSIAEMGEPRHRVDVELRSLGAPTDALLEALSARLLVPLPEGTRARPVLRMDGASLRGDPTNPAKEKLRLRFFFPSRHDVDKNPFELLGGLDLGAGEFSLTEKWDVYRDTLVHALAYVAARDAN